MREQRLQKLFADCQQQVINQILGPFGLSMAMFEDKNGGNVTTLHNFSREDSDYVATDNDKKMHDYSRTKYSKEIRSEYEIHSQASANSAGGQTWDQKRNSKISQGKDEYTGFSVNATDQTVKLADGRDVRAELDHVVSIGEVHNNPKMHLALGKVVQDQESGKAKVDVSAIRTAVNSEENLALTNQSLNGSKSDNDLMEWSNKKRENGKTNQEHFGVDAELMENKYREAKSHIEATANNELIKKQATELLQTGGTQALKMGMRQALGLLLTELANSLFNEIKVLVSHGIEAGKTLFEDIKERLSRVIKSVVDKIPDAISHMIEGGISGFMSNLITFLLNNLISTAKRFVTIIREGIIGLFKAFKMIFFPPHNMSNDQAMQAGLKILAGVVATTIGFLLNESVAAFMLTVPFLKPVADIVTPVLVGIVTGLLSAFLAYQIDCLFDSYRFSNRERAMDELMADTERREAFAQDLKSLSEKSLANIENYSNSIKIYQHIGATIGKAGAAASATLASLESVNASTARQVTNSRDMVDYINLSQIEIEAFLKGI